MISITQKLEHYRIDHDLTKKKIAELSGQTQENLGNKMNRDNWKIQEIEKICDALNITLEINFIDSDGHKY